MSAMINETLLRLGGAIAARIARLEMINRVSHQIASTIETREVITLVSAAVQEALLADTYFMGLLPGEGAALADPAFPDSDQERLPQEDGAAGTIHLELFFDDGEFFPPLDVPLEGTLAGWVIAQQRSLLLRDIPHEASKLGLNVRVIGKPKSSLSWIGAPLLAGSHIIGLLAAASYRRNAFDEGDLELLENLAQQAAFVIDNARHHAEVVHQSHLDSLTQVYNHSYFLEVVKENIEHSRLEGTQASLIMLDVDLFKHYNDTYGHLVGDQALRQVVAAIRGSTRRGDAIGRWGGEELSILLPGVGGEQATQVARRIRQHLASRQLKSTSGEPIPAPTVSQGIAVFPQDASEAEKLVDVADQRLYRAKARGRDQIEPELAYWSQIAFPEF
jgi:diguanylate cyclase (GGDEF)-like protein